MTAAATEHLVKETSSTFAEQRNVESSERMNPWRSSSKTNRWQKNQAQSHAQIEEGSAVQRPDWVLAGDGALPVIGD